MLTILYGGPEGDEKKKAGVGAHVAAGGGSADSLVHLAALLHDAGTAERVQVPRLARALISVHTRSTHTCFRCDPKGRPETMAHSEKECGAPLPPHRDSLLRLREAAPCLRLGSSGDVETAF